MEIKVRSALEVQGSTSPLHAEQARIGETSPDSSFASEGSDFEDLTQDDNPDGREHATSDQGDTEEEIANRGRLGAEYILAQDVNIGSTHCC